MEKQKPSNRPSIHEIFKMLGLEQREDRVKLSFGATTLEAPDQCSIKTEYIIVNPNGDISKGELENA